MRKTTVLLFAMTSFMAIMEARAEDYTVGGSLVWNLGVNYTNWASGKTFKVGDALEFKYAPSLHNVLEVSKSSYDSCLITNPMKIYVTGSDKISLSSAGPKYFICGIPGHCSAGMKVSMNVMASSSSSKSPSPSASKSPSPSASSSSAETPMTSSAPHTTSTSPSAPAPAGVGVSAPNNDNSASSSLSAATVSGVSFLVALVLCVF